MRADKQRARGLRLKLVSAAVMSCFASAGLANPIGPSAPAGIDIQGVGTSAVTIKNNTGANAIINWQGFSIGVGELTQFSQFANLAVLNRVTVVDPANVSNILGTLISDGKVFLINPNGITIGAGATLDLPGFVASSLNLTDDDFNAGRMRFQAVPGAGNVVNNGNISTALYPTGQVYLVGPAVTNGGVISSPNGEVVLAAGNSVELVSPGAPGLSVVLDAPANQAVNVGQIFADSGTVGMFGGLVTQQGVVSANSVVPGADGSIKLVATDTATFTAGSNTSSGSFDVDAGSVLIKGDVHTGAQSIRASGGVIVENDPGTFAQLSAVGAQSIEAGSVEVSAHAGGSASLYNFDGPQHIVANSANAAGEAVAVRAVDGGQAFLSANSGSQSIDVTGSGRVVVDAVSSGALIEANGGLQSIHAEDGVLVRNGLISGRSGQAIEARYLTVETAPGLPIGAPTGLLSFGGEQRITTSGADAAGKGLTVRNGAGGFPTIQGDSQNINIATTLSVQGGPGNAQILNTSGVQSIAAGAIELQGASGSTAGSALISAASGSQVISAGAGGITLRGGADGANNFAMINQVSTDPLASQTITSAGPVLLEGGSGNFNFAMIRAFGGHQDLSFGDTTLLAGATGIDNFSVIQARDQDMTVHGNLALVGRGSAGSPTIGGGSRIGGLGGGAPTGTELQLNVDGDFSMTGGTVSGSLLGNTTNFTGNTNISVLAHGNVTVSGGAAPGVNSTIGSRATNLAGGHISIVADGAIALNSAAPTQTGGIRTTDGVTLTAQRVTQGPDAYIQAGSLAVYTQEGAQLGGANAVGQFDGVNGWIGDIALNNASPLLTMTNVQNFGGGLYVQQAGDLLVNGQVVSGPQTIAASGGLTVQPGTSGSAVLVSNFGSQWIEAGPGGISLLGGDAGANNFAMINQASTDPLATQTLRTTGPLALRGGDDGNLNFAMVRAFGGLQDIEAGPTTLNAGLGGVSNFASIQAEAQSVRVHGDLAVSAFGSATAGSIGGGASIGGRGGSFPSATNLTLDVDGSIELTGGTAPGVGVAIGGGTTSTEDTNISIHAGGNLTMNPGTASGAGARIGSRGTGVAGGNIDIAAMGVIAQNSTTPDMTTVIRTLDGVTLTAQRITQGPDAHIEAGSLTVDTQEGALLGGANVVSQFNGTNGWFGDIVLNNASPLLTMTSVQNPGGGLSVQQAGDLLVNGFVFSGTQLISTTGGLTVRNDPWSAASLGAAGDQTIASRYLEVIAQEGGGASVSSSGAIQRIATTGRNAAGEGLVVRAAGGDFANITMNAGAQEIDVRNADRVSIDGATGVAAILDFNGVQSVSLSGAGANELVLGSPGALAQAVIGGGGFQSVVAGNPGERGSITLYGTQGGVGNTLIVSNQVPGGTQFVHTPGAISVYGGSAAANSAAGIFANGIGGMQDIHGRSILLEGGSVGSGNNAQIGANSGSQLITVGPGGITLRGGADGANNFAMINQVSTDPSASQTITSTGPVLLEGGSGNFNFAMIRAFGGHQDLSFGDTTLLAGAGGIDNFSVIQARNQDIAVHGDLELRSRASGGSPTIGGGARIGGLGGGAPTGTELRLNVDGNFTMTGGDLSGTGVILGDTTNYFGDTNIALHVGGDLSMNGGSVPGTYAVIGQRGGGSGGGGDIAITVGGAMAMNGSAPDQASIIRTDDAVSLTARSITQGPDARIEAGSLTVHTQDGTNLWGTNTIGQFDATNDWTGDIALRNASPQLTMTNVRNFGGGLDVQQTGNLLVNGFVLSWGQSIDVTSGLIVENLPGEFASLGAQGGQSIRAGYIEVYGHDGGQAGISNYQGDQTIGTNGENAAGESLALRSFDGGVASVSSSEGHQSILLSGSGSNALVMETQTAPGLTNISGDSQTIIAGGPGENGSITMHGPSSQIVSSALPGGTQTVSTSGALRLMGSEVSGSSSSAGIFAQGIGGLQTVQAQSIELQGGVSNGATITTFNGPQLLQAGSGGIVMQGGHSGANGAATIVANSASQVIESLGGITLRGGADGANNFAMVNQVSTDPLVTQTITSTGPVLLEGGSGNLNFAMIRAFGGHQDLSFGDTTLLAGAAGIDNFSVIQARNQDMSVHGNLDIRSRASAGSPAIGGGSRIGGLGGGAPTGTELRLNVDGNLAMTGGDLSGTGVILGNANVFSDTNIAVNVGGDLSMNGGSVPGTYAVIGQRGGGSGGGGDIAITVGGAMAMNSSAPDQASIIRTDDAVSLTAQSITQGHDARIEAGSLTVHTQDGAQLGGANAVDQLAMVNSTTGAVDFNNTSALLTVTGIDQVPHGALSLSQDGDMRILGDVASGNQSMDVTGDMTVSPGAGPGVTVQARGSQTFNVGGSFSLLGGTALGGYAETLAKGPVRITTGGDLNVRGGGGLLAYALLYGDDDIRLTVGDQVHVDGGSGLLAFARIQTDFWERIFLTFPNSSGGSYFVDGREGVPVRGLDGFFNGLIPARPGRGLILSYGL
jgi:filamentous hemagglutinin family protein